MTANGCTVGLLEQTATINIPTCSVTKNSGSQDPELLFIARMKRFESERCSLSE